MVKNQVVSIQPGGCHTSDIGHWFAATHFSNSPLVIFDTKQGRLLPPLFCVWEWVSALYDCQNQQQGEDTDQHCPEDQAYNGTLLQGLVVADVIVGAEDVGAQQA